MTKTFINSGDFSGANVVQGSTITDLKQSAQVIATNTGGANDELVKLVDQLTELLSRVPAEAGAEGHALAEASKTYLAELQKPEANPNLLEAYGTAFRLTAKKLMSHAPGILDITNKILAIGIKLSGNG